MAVRSVALITPQCYIRKADASNMIHPTNTVYFAGCLFHLNMDTEGGGIKTELLGACSFAGSGYPRSMIGGENSKQTNIGRGEEVYVKNRLERSGRADG